MEKTQEEKERWIKLYFETQETIEMQEKMAISNTVLIEWLQDFLKDRPIVSDKLYYKENISELDKNNLSKLYLFYNGILNYGEKNHIYPTMEDGCAFFRVKLNDFGFIIGKTEGIETTYFAVKEPIEEDKYYIDFNDIMTDKNNDSLNKIVESLDNFKKTIRETYNNGVPIEDLVNTFNLTITQIIDEKRNQQLIKKGKN